jgi:cell wall assembly regulator SMI1
MKMKELWNRLEQWLKEQAPDVYADLNPGVSQLEIDNLEGVIGYKLPNDLRESLMIHNGQRGESDWLFAGWELLSTDRILDEWLVWKDLYDKGTFEDWEVDVIHEGIKKVWWNPAWIPLTYNGAGDHHCIDLAPANGGLVGQIISMWHDWEERRVLANGYRQWFEYIISEFESNDVDYVFESGDFDFDMNTNTNKDC